MMFTHKLEGFTCWQLGNNVFSLGYVTLGPWHSNFSKTQLFFEFVTFSEMQKVVNHKI